MEKMKMPMPPNEVVKEVTQDEYVKAWCIEFGRCGASGNEVVMAYSHLNIEVHPHFSHRAG